LVRRSRTVRDDATPRACRPDEPFISGTGLTDRIHHGSDLVQVGGNFDVDGPESVELYANRSLARRQAQRLPY